MPSAPVALRPCGSDGRPAIIRRVTEAHGFEVRVRGRIGPAALRAFEPWTVQGIDGETSILMPYADRNALNGLLSVGECGAVRPPWASARGAGPGRPRAV